MFSSMTGMNAAQSGEAPGSGPQILYAALLTVVVYLVFIFIEVIYNYYNRMSMNRTELLPNTYVMNDKSQTIVQNPNIPGSKPVHLSENERSGIEFSYSFYLNGDLSLFTLISCKIFPKFIDSDFVKL